jgi:hypothetical protein
MSKIDIESAKSFIGQQAMLNDADGEGVGIVIGISDDGMALIQKCVDFEGLEETDETVQVPVEEIKLRTFVVMEKVDAGMTEGALVSWETSNGTYYGDVQSVSMDGTVRGEPQGLEIEGSEERPAYVVRVWMWDEDEWMATNVTVVAYADALTMVEELPEPMEDEEAEDEETEDMPAMEQDGAKTMNIEKITEIVAREVAKALAGLEDVEIKSDAVEAEVADAVAEEAPAEEVVAEEAVAEDAAEEAPAEEKSEEVVVEEKTEEVSVEEVKSEETVVETAKLTFEDLKEFNDLFKVL